MSPIGRSARECSPPCAGCSSSMADTQARLAGSRRIHSSERVTQKIELSFRNLADSCLLLVDRELQLAHDLAQLLQGFFGFASPAQDHEVVGVGHDARAEALFQPEHLPSHYEPAHVEIRQQW